jgi:hypothetical protein
VDLFEMACCREKVHMDCYTEWNEGSDILMPSCPNTVGSCSGDYNVDVGTLNRIYNVEEVRRNVNVDQSAGDVPLNQPERPENAAEQPNANAGINPPQWMGDIQFGVFGQYEDQVRQGTLILHALSNSISSSISTNIAGLIRGNQNASNPLIGAQNNRQVINHSANIVLTEYFSNEMEATFPGVVTQLNQQSSAQQQSAPQVNEGEFADVLNELSRVNRTNATSASDPDRVNVHGNQQQVNGVIHTQILHLNVVILQPQVRMKKYIDRAAMYDLCNIPELNNALKTMWIGHIEVGESSSWDELIEKVKSEFTQIGKALNDNAELK